MNHQSEKPADTSQPIIGFAAGTPIRTPGGHKPIEDVKPGDLIQTRPDDEQGDHEPEAHKDRHLDDDIGWWEWN